MKSLPTTSSSIYHTLRHARPCATLFLAMVLVFQLSALQAQQLSEAIRLNQLGFYPKGEKIAVLVGEHAGGKFYVKTADLSKTVFTGTLSALKAGEFSKRPTRIADFSSFSREGSYVVEIPGLGHSYAFTIKPGVHQEVGAAALKGFYLIRASTALPEAYAGKWHRPAGHPDTQVQVHPSAASATRPAGTVLASPKGWYDAGDYNKYIVNSGISMGTLLAAYEDFPDYFKKQTLSIPESNNQVPDILDETLWNLRWMLTMQDPADGGVYHKLTTANFEGMIMPDKARNQRYVVQKGTAATLDFAAVMAQASRIYRQYNKEFPGLADSCLQAATKAWDWAQQHPNVLYQQEEMNKSFTPPITTGTYGDEDVSDEFIWAAAELYVTTGKDTYYNKVNLFPDTSMPLPSWPQVRLLGYYTLLRHEQSLGAAAKKDLPALKKQLLTFADDLMEGASGRSYRTVMGKSDKDYIWGSSAVAANQGIALLQAYRISSDKKYLQAAISNLDYLLGRNATGYSFVTGFGAKPVMNPHHRPSVADAVKDPVPGLLSGGPNASAPRQDQCTTYTSAFADEVFTDDDCSYASNEIAINWNAPLVYLINAIEAYQQKPVKRG